MIRQGTRPNISDRLLSLSGFIGSGKSTAAKILIEDFGYTEIAFADKLKDICSITFGWPRNLLEGDTLESREFRETLDKFWTRKLGFDVSPRKMLRMVGTGLFRKYFHEDIWIYSVFNEIEKNPDKKFVITDARFRNELRKIVDNDGFTCRVVKGNEPHWASIAKKAYTPTCPEYLKMLNSGIDISEWEWLVHSFDYLIDNNGTVEDLRNSIGRMLE